MTSLARKWKGMADVGRCLLPTTIPPRQPRRIQILFPHVAVISQSEGGDVGPAVTPPRGCRATPIHPGCFLPLAGVLGGRVVERVGSDATASFLHLVRRPAKNADQHFAKSFCPVAPSVFGSLHSLRMEQPNAESVAPAYVNRRR